MIIVSASKAVIRRKSLFFVVLVHWYHHSEFRKVTIAHISAKIAFRSKIQNAPDNLRPVKIVTDSPQKWQCPEIFSVQYVYSVLVVMLITLQCLQTKNFFWQAFWPKKIYTWEYTFFLLEKKSQYPGIGLVLINFHCPQTKTFCLPSIFATKKSTHEDFVMEKS
jgi:hypothetical protein